MQNLNKVSETKVARLLTYGGQVIDPTAYIYMCCEVINWSKFGLFNGY